MTAATPLEAGSRAGSPVKALALVLGYLLAAASAGSVVAWLLYGVLDYPYFKILSRSVLLFAAMGLIPLWRSAGLSAGTIGLTPVAVRHMALAYPVGIAVVLPLMLFFMVVEFRVWDDRVDYAGLAFWRFVALAFASSILVGVFEETLFRGVLFTALRRRGSFAWSAFWVGLTYAAVHFLAGGADRFGGVEIHWYTGYFYVLDAFSGLAAPATFWDSFVALFLLGVLFCWVRERAGLWWCIGLHSAWVFAIRTFKEMTVRDVFSPYQAWVGTYDNFVGHLVSVWLIFVFVVLALHQLARAR